jgi:hypothetical protein
METANIVRVSGKEFQNALFPKLVLVKITAEEQDRKARTATRAEVEHLSHGAPVRYVHTHNNVFLDTYDVIERVAEVMTALKPSADPQHQAGSLIEALEKVVIVRLEIDDLVDVIGQHLTDLGVNWRELPSMQEPFAPTVTEFIH